MLNHKLLGSVSSLPSDANFENVSLLLSGDGTNGAQNNTFLDSSTNNFTITRNGNTTQGSFSPYGDLWSNYFSNTSAMSLSFPSNAAFAFGTGDFTVEGWINGSGLSGSEKGIWGIGPTGGVANNTTVRINAGKFSFWCGGSANNVVTNTTLSDGVWYHFALVRQSGTFRFYINGVQDTTSTTGGSYNQTAESGKIGQNYNDQSIETFNGYISNIRVVKGTAVYPNGTTFTPNTTPLTAITNTSLLACQSNRFIDNSSNNFTLTVNGTPSVQRFSPFNPTSTYATATIGGSGYFAASGTYLQAAANTAFELGSGDFTLECWVYLTANGNSNGSGLISKGSFNSLGNEVYTLQVNNSNIVQFYAFSASTSYTSPVVASSAGLSLNTWYHVAITKSGSTNTMWINGVSSNTASSSYTITTGGTMNIGGTWYDPSDSAREITGYICDSRVVKGTAVYTTTFTPPTAPLSAITNTQLLLHYTNAGIPDSAMMNDLETVGNAQVSTSVKKYGTGSLYFDGTGDYLITYNQIGMPTNGAFTVECWVYLNANTNGVIFAKGGGAGSWSTSNGHQFLLFMDSGTLYWMWNNGGSNTQITTSSPSTGSWHWLTVGYDGTTTRFWVDGTSVGTSTTGYTLPTTRNIVTVGVNPDQSTSPLNGYVDDLRFTQGLDRYGVGNSTITPPTSALPTY